MAMVVNNNIPALSTYNVINSTSNSLANSIKKLSTGLRINSAADDAAGLAISEKMRAQISGLDQAVSNSQDGISMIQTAEGALNETHSILQRMRELSVQAANDTLTQQDRSYIQEEVNQLREEITRIGDTTQFNKKKLLNGDAAAIWSSDNLNTKAIVNGGLRTIDQFGQKSSAEGNYRITIDAQAGTGEVQKTSLFRIKHDVPDNIIESEPYEGVSLTADAEPTMASNSKALTITYDGTDYEVELTGKYDDTDALIAAIKTAKDSSDNALPSGLTITADSNGKLTFTPETGKTIKLTGAAATDLVGSTGDTSNASVLTGTAAPNTSSLDGMKFKVTITGDNDTYTGEVTFSSPADAAAVKSALAGISFTDSNGDAATVDFDVDLTADDGYLQFSSKDGTIKIEGDDTNGTNDTQKQAAFTALMGGSGATSLTSSETTALTGADKASLNYVTKGGDFDGAKFSVNGTDITVSAGVGTDVDKLVEDINTQLAADTNLDPKVVASNADGKVRLATVTGNTITVAAHSDGTDDASKIFGTVTANNGTDDLTADEAAQLLDSSEVYAFEVKDTDGNTIGKVSISNAAFTPTAQKSAGELLADEINTQLQATKDSTLGYDATAVWEVDEETGEGKIVIKSPVEFTIEDSDDDTGGGYAALLGKEVKDASKERAPEETTIGDVAHGYTKLRDLQQFWDASGNFLLTDPQTITITQGDGKQASITLYQNDTLDSVAEKINDAIKDDVSKGGLGQGQYLNTKDTQYSTAQTKFADYVEANGVNSEAVAGTMLIRSIVPGSNGTLSFSGSEELINALGLNTIQDASESRYTVNIYDAHTGDQVVTDAKITGNKLIGELHPNVDVEFDAMSGVKAVWNDTDKKFEYQAGTETTYLHLSDNTTVFQIGANEGEDMGINIGDMRSHALGLDAVNVMNRDSASRSITVIDNAIDKVSTQRAKLGAYQNRLEHTINNLTVASENLTSAESRIRDTDMAKEMMNFTKLQIMLQAGNSMLAQANQLPQNVLSLVR